MTGACELERLIFTEGNIAQLCGKAVFERAREYFSDGAVLNPRLEDGVLLAEVVGSADEPYDVEIAVRQGRLEATCTCPYEFTCKHIGAVLLTWLRQREGVSGTGASHDNEAALEAEQGWRIRPQGSASDDLTGLLAPRTLKELREIGRRRGIVLRGTAKDDLLRQLALRLLDPIEIQGYVSPLSRAELACIDLVYILGDDSAAGAPAVEDMLGDFLAPAKGEASSILRNLAGAGLILVAQAGSEQVKYRVPGAVVGQLPPTGLFDAGLSSGKVVKEREGAGPAADEVLYLVCGYLKGRRIEKRPIETTALIERSPLLRGWRNVAAEVAELEKPGKNWEWSEKVTLTALPPLPLLSDTDLHHLERITGLGSVPLDFFLHLLRELRLVRGKDTFAVQEDMLRYFLSVPPVWRRRATMEAWLRLTGWNELMEMLRGSDGLRMRRRMGHLADSSLEGFREQMARARRVVARLLARLPEGVWLSMPAVVEIARSIAWREFSGRGARWPSEKPAWWLESRGGKRLDAGAREDWSAGYGRAVVEIIRGPLRWLGVARIGEAYGDDVFRLDGIRWLLGLIDPPVEPTEQLSVGEDLTVSVPSNYEGGLTVHIFLRGIGETVGFNPQGTTYRLTAKQVCDSFAKGYDAERIISFLEARSKGALPGRAAATLRTWWESYGKIRLYPKLTLLEFADDYTLPELMSSTSLASHLLYRFSSRTVAVDPERVDGLINELKRKGYTPKIGTASN